VRTTNQKIIAVVLFVFSLIYFSSGFKYKIGTHKVMGPGFFPLLIGVLLLVCTGIHLLRVMKIKGREDGEAETSAGEGVNYRAIVGIIACAVGYPLILEYAKFVPSTFAAGFAMLLLLKPKSLISSFLLSAGMAVGCFLIFSRLFGVALPSGPIEDLLFRIGG
jgi:hypothetical protein